MPRLDVRSNVKIPVIVLFGRNDIPPQSAVTSNLGLNGAFINSTTSVPEDTVVKLRAHLPRRGEFVINGRVLRKEKSGLAVKFFNIDKDMKVILWQYIKEKLPDELTCPYCGYNNQFQAERCERCGLSLNFDSETFLDIHEEEIKEKWIQYIDIATIELLESLRSIEKEIESGGTEPEKTYNKIINVINDFLQKAERFEHEIGDKEIIKNAQIDFRLKTNHIFSKSYCINRTRTWPQGHQGDYKTLEGVYRNIPLSEGIGYYLDLVSLNLPLAEAVRNRIKKLEEILKDEIIKRKGPAILNIACGSCRELMGIASEIRESKAKIICIDNDNDALAFAQNRLSYTGILPQVELRKYNALRMFDDELNMSEFGKQDIIYSVGLFDYLPSEFLIKMLRALYKLLNPGGKLIAAFKDANQYKSQVYHWIGDWDGFLQRNEEDFRDILYDAKIPHSAIEESREDTGIIIFYIITK
ncbi:MAG: methyltransferase domain-containing protein [Nitrospirota bacterium]